MKYTNYDFNNKERNRILMSDCLRALSTAKLGDKSLTKADNILIRCIIEDLKGLGVEEKISDSDRFDSYIFGEKHFKDYPDCITTVYMNTVYLCDNDSPISDEYLESMDLKNTSDSEKSKEKENAADTEKSKEKENAADSEKSGKLDKSGKKDKSNKKETKKQKNEEKPKTNVVSFNPDLMTIDPTTQRLFNSGIDTDIYSTYNVPSILAINDKQSKIDEFIVGLHSLIPYLNELQKENPNHSYYQVVSYNSPTDFELADMSSGRKVTVKGDKVFS